MNVRLFILSKKAEALMNRPYQRISRNLFISIENHILNHPDQFLEHFFLRFHLIKIFVLQHLQRPEKNGKQNNVTIWFEHMPVLQHLKQLEDPANLLRMSAVP